MLYTNIEGAHATATRPALAKIMGEYSYMEYQNHDLRIIHIDTGMVGRLRRANCFAIFNQVVEYHSNNRYKLKRR